VNDKMTSLTTDSSTTNYWLQAFALCYAMSEVMAEFSLTDQMDSVSAACVNNTSVIKV